MYTDIKRSKVTAITTEFFFATPSNTTELSKIIAIVAQYWQTEHPDAAIYDDTLKVMSNEDGITISWLDSETSS